MYKNICVESSGSTADWELIDLENDRINMTITDSGEYDDYSEEELEVGYRRISTILNIEDIAHLLKGLKYMVESIEKEENDAYFSYTTSESDNNISMSLCGNRRIYDCIRILICNYDCDTSIDNVVELDEAEEFCSTLEKILKNSGYDKKHTISYYLNNLIKDKKFENSILVKMVEEANNLKSISKSEYNSFINLLKQL